MAIIAFGKDLRRSGYTTWLYDSLHLQVAVSVVAFDHVRNTLATLHRRCDQCGEHFENSLAGASALLPENGQDAAKLEPKVVLLSVPPPLREMPFILGERGLVLTEHNQTCQRSRRWRMEGKGSWGRRRG